jgi:hypothetical protein
MSMVSVEPQNGHGFSLVVEALETIEPVLTSWAQSLEASHSAILLSAGKFSFMVY